MPISVTRNKLIDFSGTFVEIRGVQPTEQIDISRNIVLRGNDKIAVIEYAKIRDALEIPNKISDHHIDEIIKKIDEIGKEDTKKWATSIADWANLGVNIIDVVEKIYSFVK